VLSQCIHLVIQLLLLAVFILLLRVPVTSTYLWLPVAIVIELAFIVGLSLITCTLNVYFRDVQYVVQSVLTILFWFTPIFYALGNAHQNLSRPLYLLFIANPLAGCIETARRGVLQGGGPEPDSFLAAVLVSALTLVFGVWMFARLQGRFSDHV
jgi:ABC-type polysaccharide/polyol phosphate export permease